MFVNSVPKEKKISFLKKIKRKIFTFLRLKYHPVVKVYHGFGNDQKILVLGHVLKLSPLPRKTYRNSWIINLLYFIRLFMVIPFSEANISIWWDKNSYRTKTGKDGFFRYEIFPELPPVKGWHKVIVKLEEESFSSELIQDEDEIYIPYETKYAFISDIDDTFLVSHSGSLRRKLFILLTKNAHSRSPFKGVVNHYRLLAESSWEDDNKNPFFYVSGSEWNLYDPITEFSRFNDLPKGILLLSAIKGITQFWKSGSNDLMTKFTRIVRVIEEFPDLKFILLGDDSQIDTKIYLSITEHFPQKIFTVYIRQTGKKKRKKNEESLKIMENYSVNTCYFRHSADAIEHSKKIGLIKSAR